MPTPVTISIPHQLGRAEARRRIASGFANTLHQMPGSTGAATQQWDGDRLTFGLDAMGQAISGTVDVLDTSVTIEVLLPGILGMIAGSLKDRLQQAGQLLLTKK